MSKKLIVTIAVLGCLGLFLLMTGVSCVSTYNREAELRNAILQKQKDNQSEFDNLWKKISQTVQVTDKSQEILKEILVGHAKERATGSGGGTLFKSFQESIPNVDMSVWTNLQNTITSSRDSFTFRQKELLDLKRERDNLCSKFPSGMFLSIMGKNQPLDVQIITSSKAENAMATGKDNDVDLFKTSKPEKE